MGIGSPRDRKTSCRWRRKFRSHTWSNSVWWWSPNHQNQSLPSAIRMWRQAAAGRRRPRAVAGVAARAVARATSRRTEGRRRRCRGRLTTGGRQVAGLVKEVPGCVVGSVATPRAQVSPDPRTRVEPAQRPRGRRIPQMLGDRHAPQRRVGAQALVEVAKEVAAVAWVVFPGVLAVESDGDQGDVRAAGRGERDAAASGATEGVEARVAPISRSRRSRSAAASRESQD